MSATFAYRLTWGIYHLCLGTWFGAMLMLVVAAGITFATVRHYQPTLGLAPYNDPVLAERAAPILAGGIVGNVLKGLMVVQVICATGVVLCLALQWAYYSGGVSRRANVMRTVLVLLPIVVLAVDVTVVSPRIWRHRQIMYDPAVPEAQRAEAHASFQTMHKLNERLVGLAALSLGAALVMSGWAMPLVMTGRAAGATDGG